MSLRGLLAIEISSVSKKLEPISNASAAIFVVTQEDIRRMGGTSVPEALRAVPGLHVARIDANKWGHQPARIRDPVLEQAPGARRRRATGC